MISFLKPITLKWWQVSIFKLSMFSFGVYLGAMWPEFFEGWTSWLLVIFIVTIFLLLPIWWKNLRQENTKYQPPVREDGDI